MSAPTQKRLLQILFFHHSATKMTTVTFKLTAILTAVTEQSEDVIPT